MQAQNNSTLYEALKAYQSSDIAEAYTLFAVSDSVDSITYYPDLWKYYVCTEKNGDSTKAETLLFRLVQSNGFERSTLNMNFFEDIDLRKRSYWFKLDSLIQIVENRRCQPFIDSLAIMAENDQNIRQKINEQGWSDEICAQMTAIDSINTKQLQVLIAKYGFPSWKLVGRSGASNAWLIAQHSYWYLPEFLNAYRQAVIADDADRRLLAYMEDRFLMSEGRPQIYGTQFVQRDTIAGYYPIMDMPNLDKRRLIVDLEPFSDWTSSIGMACPSIHPDYLDYQKNYYPNNAKMYANIDAHWHNNKGLSEWYFDQSYFGFARDLEVLALYILESDTSLAVQQAKKMVLQGKRLDEEWHLPKLLMDSVTLAYQDLRADYERLMTKEVDAKLNSIVWFDTLVNVLENGFYPRYTFDAWNGNIKKLIAEKAKTLAKNDYLDFFQWLFEQVKLGNYHLFDYAELYDEVYYRLFGKSYYGQQCFKSYVPLYQPCKVRKRRSSIQLPPMRVWQRIRKYQNKATGE